MTTIQITGVNHELIGGNPVFRFNLQFDDGRTKDHVMPTMIIEARAGEYGLHPVNDRATIIDMILHEPHMEPIPDEQLHRDSQNPGPRQPGDIVHLFNANSIDEARTAHLARVEATKAHTHVVWSGNSHTALAAGKTDPVALVMNWPTDDQAIQAHAARVFKARGDMGREVKKPLPTLPPTFFDPRMRARGLSVSLLD